MQEKKRHSVSVMIGGGHSYFTHQMIRGIAEKAREEDVNPYFFLRIHTKPFFRGMLGDISNNYYDYQFNTIHDYSRIAGTEGSIVGYGTIGFHMQVNNVESFASRYNDQPLVIVTEKSSLPNCHCIISDNRRGMHDLVNHLITDSGCRKILFMRGPEGNTDAIERYMGYLDAMSEHGLSVEPKMIGLGDYSAYMDDEIECILDANPDADGFAFSNDEMASSCYRVCKKRGIRIGKDLMVTGFDSGRFAEKMVPPLTSVFQDSHGMGVQAVSDMVRILNGAAPSLVRYPVQLMVRESSGTAVSAPKKADTHFDWHQEREQLRQDAANREQDFQEYQGKSWYIPMMARELNDSMDSEPEFCREIMEKLRILNAGTAYLFLLDHSLSYDGVEEWSCPDNLFLAAWLRNGETFAYQPYDRPRVTRERGIAQLTDDGKLHQFMVFLLFSGDRQYGLLACDVPVEELSFFYVVSLQLGLSLHYFELAQIQEMNRRRMAQDMERIRAKNMELDRLSGYDMLSGLLNLRGLTMRVNQMLANGVRCSGYVIYCDLDHLKQINDYFGHSAGDYAISACADILRSCIRDSDAVARTGGDEFICMVLTEDPTFAEKFRTRLREACEKENNTSGQPFYVGISVGIQPLMLNSYEDFSTAAALADHALYEAKKHRRQDVRRDANL